MGEIWFGDMGHAERRNLVTGLLDRLEELGFRPVETARRKKRERGRRPAAAALDRFDTTHGGGNGFMATLQRDGQTWTHLVPHSAGAELVVLVFGANAEDVWWDLMDRAEQLLPGGSRP